MGKKSEATRQTHKRPQVLMEWTVHLARRQPLKAVAVIFIIAFVVAFGWLFVHPFVAFLMGLFLLNAVSEFLFPVRYKLTNDGVQVSSFLHDRSMGWEQVRRLDVFPNGVFLSPYLKPNKLDSLRGVWLRWDGEPERLQALVKICQAKIKKR